MEKFREIEAQLQYKLNEILDIDSLFEDYVKERNEYHNSLETDLFKQRDKLQKEVSRLNNIINELEKYIKTEIPEDDFINSELCVNILDKLQELKEGK